MINQKTILVLGAGASSPYGFPLGNVLVERISSFAPVYQIKNPGYTDHAHPASLHPSFSSEKLEEFRRQLRESECYSIDAFLSNHPEFDVIGRASIASVLIPCEISTNLYAGESNWYKYLKNNMGDSFAEFKQSLENLVIVTFNYDRSFEYYFWNSLRASYDQDKAKDLLQTMEIIHVHGQLGKPDFLAKDGRPYSPNLDRATVEKAVAEIKVVSDKLDDSEEFQKAREHIRSAEKLCFIGFGYNATNLRRLQLQKHFAGHILLGTAWGCEADEHRRIKDQLGGPSERHSQTMGELLRLGNGDEDAYWFLRRYSVLD